MRGIKFKRYKEYCNMLRAKNEAYFIKATNHPIRNGIKLKFDLVRFGK